MINGVLVEKSVKDVTPALQTNSEGLKKVLDELVKQYKRQQDDMEKWKVGLDHSRSIAFITRRTRKSPKNQTKAEASRPSIRAFADYFSFDTEEKQHSGCATIDFRYRIPYSERHQIRLPHSASTPNPVRSPVIDGRIASLVESEPLSPILSFPYHQDMLGRSTLFAYRNRR